MRISELGGVMSDAAMLLVRGWQQVAIAAVGMASCAAITFASLRAFSSFGLEVATGPDEVALISKATLTIGLIGGGFITTFAALLAGMLSPLVQERGPADEQDPFEQVHWWRLLEATLVGYALQAVGSTCCGLLTIALYPFSCVLAAVMAREGIGSSAGIERTRTLLSDAWPPLLIWSLLSFALLCAAFVTSLFELYSPERVSDPLYLDSLLTLPNALKISVPIILTSIAHGAVSASFYKHLNTSRSPARSEHRWR